jgi:hypothetical protein
LRFSNGFCFSSVHHTGVTPLPYTINIKLGNNGNGMKQIEMTAVYGGVFKPRIILTAPIKTFDKTNNEPPYTGNGNFGDMLDYVIPKSKSTLRRAMKVPENAQARIYKAFAATRRTPDDAVRVRDYQNSQCWELFARIPKESY